MIPWSPARPRARGLALAVGALLAVAAAGLALPGLTPDAPALPEIVPGTHDGDEAAVAVAGLDVHPLGRHRLEVKVDLASEDGAAHGGLSVRVEARGAGDQLLAGDALAPVEVPAQGRWSGVATLTQGELVAGLDHVQVQVGEGSGPGSLP